MTIHNFKSYFDYYVELVEGPWLESMEKGLTDRAAFFQAVPDDKWDYKYSEGKWTIKQMLQHIIDCERIFCYRALSIARDPAQSLAGFDHDKFADMADTSGRSSDQLINEYKLVRQSTIALFKSFSDREFKNSGVANGLDLSVETLAFLVSGHELHHIKVLKEKYL